MGTNVRLMAALAATVLAAAPLAAQDAPPRPAPPPAPGRGAGPGAMGILGLKEQLGLTDEQVKRLEALRESHRERLRPDNAEMLRARADYLEAVQGDEIDLARARAALERMQKMRTDAALARLQARKETLAVLTAEQRSRLEQLRMRAPRGRPGMGRGFHPGMGHGRPGMRGRGQGWGGPGAFGPGNGPGGPGMQQRLRIHVPPPPPPPTP